MLNVIEISQKITGVKASVKTMRGNVQTILVNIAGHAYEHGDVTLASKLLDATAGANQKAIVQFLTTYAFTNVKPDGTVTLNKKARKEADFADGAAVVEALAADAAEWWTLKPAGKTNNDLEIPKKIDAITKAIQEGEKNIKGEMAAIRESYNAMIAAYEAALVEANRKAA